MEDKYKRLLLEIQETRKESETTAEQMVKEFQDSINTYEELKNYFEESIDSFIANKWELLFSCLVLSYKCDSSKIERKQRRNIALGMFFMALYELEIENCKNSYIPYEIEMNDMDDLEFFVQNRLNDAHYVMEGILYYKGNKNPQEFIDNYTYKGIKTEAFNYFGFGNHQNRAKK